MKNVQIPESLFYNLVRYHILEKEEVLPEIKKELEQKVEAVIKRNLYSQYKTAETENEREEARKKYLDKVKAQRDCR